MAVLDYARSSITFTTFGRTNHARIQVEARCVHTRPGEPPQESWLVASCKAEDTYGEGALFLQPNYDFAMMYSRERYRIMRIAAEHDAALSESGSIASRFEHVHFDLRLTDSVERLATDEQVVTATLAGRRLVAQNQIELGGGAVALLEYPIKTMNVNPERVCWQVDTGPLLAPEPGAQAGELEALGVAFAAFRTWDKLELIVRSPLAVSGGATVDHYHEIRTMPAANVIWALA